VREETESSGLNLEVDRCCCVMFLGDARLLEEIFLSFDVLRLGLMLTFADLNFSIFGIDGSSPLCRSFTIPQYCFLTNSSVVV
jgi:hypothetical protein